MPRVADGRSYEEQELWNARRGIAILPSILNPMTRQVRWWANDVNAIGFIFRHAAFDLVSSNFEKESTVCQGKGVQIIICSVPGEGMMIALAGKEHTAASIRVGVQVRLACLPDSLYC